MSEQRMRGGSRVTRERAIVAVALALLAPVAADAGVHIESIDQAAGSVTFLQTPDAKSPTRVHIGSGFLIAIDDENRARRFLVTAAHVARNFSEATTVTVRDEADRPVTMPLAELASPRPLASRITVHEKADVALVELGPGDSTRPGMLLEGHYVDLMLLVPTRAPPSRSRVLMVLGFPLALGIVDAFSPIARDTKAASGFVNLACAEGSPDVCTYFVTQEPSIGGFSGAPILDFGHMEGMAGGPTADHGQARIVGMAVGTLTDDNGGKMGVIVPAFYVVELFATVGVSYPSPAPTPPQAPTPAGTAGSTPTSK